MKRFFVTGTDTNVGKTFVTCALARAARARKQRVFAFKPIESGCSNGELGEDQRALVAAAGGWQTNELSGLYVLTQPLAPSVAARIDGVQIDLERIRLTIDQGSQRADLVLVEGAGGWRVPISDTEGMSTLARCVGDVIVVARAGLGTINHSLLTLEAIERDGLRVEALILSTRPEDDPSQARSNAEEVRKRWTDRVYDISEIDRLQMFHVEHPD